MTDAAVALLWLGVVAVHGVVSLAVLWRIRIEDRRQIARLSPQHPGSTT